MKILVLTEENATEIGSQTGVLVHPVPPYLTAVTKWNLGAYYAVKNGAKALVLGADDLWWQDYWLDEALKVYDGRSIIGINDMGGHNLADLATHWLAPVSYLQEVNGGVFVVPYYMSWFLDAENIIRAKRAERYLPAYAAKVDHRHVAWRKSPNDHTYSLGSMRQQYDKLVYTNREARGFPNDYPPMF